MVEAWSIYQLISFSSLLQSDLMFQESAVNLS
jgi:hypothetical protein